MKSWTYTFNIKQENRHNIVFKHGNEKPTTTWKCMRNQLLHENAWETNYYMKMHEKPTTTWKSMHTTWTFTTIPAFNVIRAGAFSRGLSIFTWFEIRAGAFSRGLSIFTWFEYFKKYVSHPTIKIPSKPPNY